MDQPVSRFCHRNAISLVMCLLNLCCFAFMTTVHTFAQDQDNEAPKELVYGDPLPLTQKAWTDPAYQISLDLPTNATMFYPNSTSDDRALAFVYAPKVKSIAVDDVNQPQWHFNMWIKNEAKPRAMKDLVGAAKRDLKNATPSAVLIEQKEFDLTVNIKDPSSGEDKESAIPVGMYHYFVPGRKQDGKFFQPRMIYSLVVVSITPSHYLLIYSRCLSDNASTRIPTLMKVIRSLDLSEMATHLQRRKTGLVRTAAWQADFRKEKIEEKLIPVQYFEAYSRNADGDWDPQGYFKMTQKRVTREDRKMNTEGYAVNVETYRRSPIYQAQPNPTNPEELQMALQGYASSLVRNEYIQSDDGRNTIWKLDEGNIRRVKGKRPKSTQVQQTGIRNRQIIQIQGTGKKSQQGKFQVPTEHYISQAEQWVLAQFLPRQKAGYYGFYWFDPSEGRVIYCSKEVTPLFSEIVVTSRYSYSRRVMTSRYNLSGELIERTIHIKPNSEIVGASKQAPGVWVKMKKIDEAQYKALVARYEALQKQDNQQYKP